MYNSQIDLQKILEDARRDFKDQMYWITFSNKYFGPNSRLSVYLKDATEEERKLFINTEIYKKIHTMKYQLKEKQEKED